ncbi:hypothetical protein E2C01_083373 [Portunus trituberculatus]|uniref:Uncharacterized protein n=1 Tax=Portunus trituberculatus TaxID=210409 RepID=A0A5B7J6E8_PORTR|nr:hypothetical protein [Portunus trituberculatus]
MKDSYLTVEKEIRFLSEMIAMVIEKHDQLIEENQELREMCDKQEKVEMKNDTKKTLNEIKRENSTLKDRCENCEVGLQDLKAKLDTNVGTGKGISKT